MSFARRNALLPRGVRLLPAALIGIAVLIFLIRALLPNVFITLAAPFWRLSSLGAAAAYDASSALKNPAELSRELEAVRADNAALAADNETLKGQVEDLQKLLGSRTAPPKGILASVLARPPESAYDTLIVDQGSSAGVLPGALVSGPGGAPLGRVATATGSSARIALFSASGVKTDAWAGDSRTPITLTGAGGGTFSATAPKDAKIAVGDPVFAVGAAAIATVTRIDTDATSPTATLRIQAIVNPFTLLWVSIAPSL